ncbi:MAG TPA: hypothetical protein VFA18_13785, partial [Gemmataceae bacterium]|nr:hypothetical protein [Gemmataceae bacterium]
MVPAALAGIKNRLHAVLAMRLVVPAVADLFGAKGQAWLHSVSLDEDGRAAVDSDLRLLAQIETELAGLDTLLAPRAYAEPRVRLLMTLPGVDYTVAQ